MPKLKPTSMFSKRNMVVLVLGDVSLKGRGIPPASSVLMPISEEFNALGVKGGVKVVSSDQMTTDSCGLLNMMYEVLVATEPTIIEAPDFSAYDSNSINNMLIAYAKMLVMTTGGFVVRVCRREPGTPMANCETSLPVINYDITADSWSDVQEKLRLLIGRTLSRDNLDYYLMLNLFSKIVKNSMGSVFLGDVSKCYLNPLTITDDKKLKAVVMLSGSSQNPISPMEFSKRVWGNDVLRDIGVENFVVLRKESPSSKIVLGKLLNEQKMVADDFRIVEL